VSDTDSIVICLGIPALNQPHIVERLEAIDSRIEVVALPADEGSSWGADTPHLPYDEPPPWALGFARERKEALARCQILIALNTPKALMQLAPRLEWIQAISAGVEQLVAADVRRDRVVVTNASGVSAPSMAEWTMGRLLQVWKRFPESDQQQRDHVYKQTYGRSLAGSVIGVVGMGSIGCEVARRARAFGCTVLGSKRSPATGEATELAHEIYGTDQLHTMLGRCDAVVIAAPASPETHHLFDRKAFDAMKPGTVLINIARGSLVDTNALLDALKTGRVGAAALDVFEEEPLPASSPLWDTENLLVSAHSSASVDRHMENVMDLFEANVKRYLAGEPLRNQVDMEGLGFA
jgi:phosphoglycerate dehydrogenase-like enzyme